MSDPKEIIIKGARVNNLKNIDVTIPRNKFIVITGLSGSGKSSLAFDTLYAEGQRRYVESLSSYARQFLGRMSKPECDYIKGIPPAIAIEQKVTSRNPRSTVGTSTEIYDYIRMLYARIGKTISPISHQEVKKHSIDDVIKFILSQQKDTRFTILTKVNRYKGRSTYEQLKSDLAQGFSRIDHQGEIISIEEYLNQLKDKEGTKEDLYLLVDRLKVSTDKESIDRMTDSTQTALDEGMGLCSIRIYNQDKTSTLYPFSSRFEADGIQFEEPNDLMFSFNSPIGACPKCEGFGKILGIDEDLVIPDKSLSVYDDAVFCWRGEVSKGWKDELIRHAEKYQFPIFTPYCDLTEEQRNLLWEGNDYISGINKFFDMLRSKQYKIQNRVMLARYRGRTTCPECRGSRLKKSASYVQVSGQTIGQLVKMSLDDLHQWVTDIDLSEQDLLIAKRILLEIKNRLHFLIDVGLNYLTLDRLSNTLSGGESQRINLATSLGSSLVGSLYILDEPSIGLHSRDTKKLIRVLRQLQQLGNTVIVVEHDEEIMRAADYIIDIGPKAGRLGGEVVYKGNISELSHGTDSYTVRYLLKEDTIPTPTTRRPCNSYIELTGCRANNLKNINVRFPLHTLSVVTGVSGSGKSSLVRDIFFKAMRIELGEGGDRPGVFDSIKGDIKQITRIEFVDQNPIGKSSRSNAATYLKVFDEIRKLWAAQPLAKQLNFSAGHFSFNSEGGRCEECKGEGVTHVEMQFMADLTLTCESCNGKRFKKETLEVEYHGKNIFDVLEMTVEEAIEFFTEHKQKKIVKRLQPLADVGLSYIKLGQSSSTLSGGENQRVKLAYYLSLERTTPTMFVFDEPTTGLHFHDISKLLESLSQLIERGHSVLVIEHNLDVIKCADYVIDIGPEGGQRGGKVVATGTPEEIAACPKSYTGQFLKPLLD